MLKDLRVEEIESLTYKELRIIHNQMMYKFWQLSDKEKELLELIKEKVINTNNI